MGAILRVYCKLWRTTIRRSGSAWRSCRPILQIDSIGAVPYGWIANDTQDGLYRLGDQAAVIPSLAGEGMAIALASAELAAKRYATHGAAGARDYQRSFARRAWRPVNMAKAIWKTASTSAGGAALTRLADLSGTLATTAMNLSRIGVVSK